MAESLRQFFNRAPVGSIVDALRKLYFGDVLRAGPTKLARKTTVAGNGTATPYDIAGVAVLVLPDNAKAGVIHRACARAGSAGVGELAPQTYGTTPSTTQCAITPCGNIAAVIGDLPTSLDVLYTPEKGEVIERTGACAASVFTVPADLVARGVIYLLEAEAVTGTVTGKKNILVPSASAAATTQARLDLAKATVKFNNGTDVVLTCRCKFLVAYEDAKDTSALLEADANMV